MQVNTNQKVRKRKYCSLREKFHERNAIRVGNAYFYTLFYYALFLLIFYQYIFVTHILI